MYAVVIKSKIESSRLLSANDNIMNVVITSSTWSSHLCTLQPPSK